MVSDTVDCEVEFPADLNRLGLFANAFRVVPEAGGECLLDFCLYSSVEKRAEVVTRIRVSRNFLPILLDRLQEEMENLREDSNVTFVLKDGMVRTPDGKVVLFNFGPGLSSEDQ